MFTTAHQEIPIGHPNRPSVNLTSLKAIVFHYTANDAPGATDTMNAKYFARKYIRTGNVYFEADGKTAFGYGSAQIVIDMDSVTFALPVTEAAWAVGDRRILPWTEQWRGQQPISRNIFGCKPNYQTFSVELCNNDAIANSLEDWNRTIENAIEWTTSFLLGKNLKVDVEGSLNKPQTITSIAPNSILLLRHFDITGKICPKPFIEEPVKWQQFVKRISSAV